jgi:hypothetical protein
MSRTSVRLKKKEGKKESKNSFATLSTHLLPDK